MRGKDSTSGIARDSGDPEAARPNSVRDATIAPSQQRHNAQNQTQRPNFRLPNLHGFPPCQHERLRQSTISPHRPESQDKTPTRPGQLAPRHPGRHSHSRTAARLALPPVSSAATRHLASDAQRAANRRGQAMTITGLVAAAACAVPSGDTTPTRWVDLQADPTPPG